MLSGKQAPFLISGRRPTTYCNVPQPVGHAWASVPLGGPGKWSTYPWTLNVTLKRDQLLLRSHTMVQGLITNGKSWGDSCSPFVSTYSRSYTCKHVHHQCHPLHPSWSWLAYFRAPGRGPSFTDTSTTSGDRPEPLDLIVRAPIQLAVSAVVALTMIVAGIQSRRGWLVADWFSQRIEWACNDRSKAWGVLILVIGSPSTEDP